jgi:hypothetical protein
MKGRVSVPALASCLDLVPSAVERAVERLSGLDLVDPVGTGWRVSGAGRSLLATASKETRVRVGPDLVEGWHDRFLSLNLPFLELVTKWQLKDGALNSHDDTTYDEKILAAVEAVHCQVVRILDDAAGVVPELGDYKRRLANAWQRIRGGNHDWLAGPFVDSHHAIWFELHQYLIDITGRTRTG